MMVKKIAFNIASSLLVIAWSAISVAQTDTDSADTVDTVDGVDTVDTVNSAAEAGGGEADMPPTPFAENAMTELSVVSKEGYQLNESGPLISLERAHQLARKNNPSFKNIDEQIVQSETLIRSAWSMLLPNISAEAKLTRNKDRAAMAFPDFGGMTFSTTDEIDAFGNPTGGYTTQLTDIPDGEEIVIQEKWQPALGLTANVTLFNARSIPLIKVAYDKLDQQKLKAQMARNDLLFAVTSSYYQIANFRELIYVNADNVKVAQESLRMAEARMMVGQGTKIDVMRAQIQVKEKERTLADALDAYHTAKRSLALFIGIKGEYQIAMPRKIPDYQKEESALAEDALKNRIEFQDAEMDVTTAKRMLEETRNKWIPKFDATWKLDVTNAAGLTGEKVNWMLIFGMNWSILEGGARIAERDERASQLRMAQNQIDQLKLDIKTDVANKVQDKVSKRRNLEVSSELVALAEENHNMISRQYEVGMANSLELTDAANELANQKIMLVLAKLEYELALLTLGKTIGEYSALALK